MTPLDTNAYVTAWLPLRPILAGDGDSGLTFAAGSHRDFALPFWHDLARVGDLGRRGYKLKGTGAPPRGITLLGRRTAGGKAGLRVLWRMEERAHFCYRGDAPRLLPSLPGPLKHARARAG
jgi:hypothetical protein